MDKFMEAAAPAFLQGLLAYDKHNVQAWHTPGHKQGRGASVWLKNLMADGLRHDLSDVLYDLTTDHSWDQLLAEAQDKAAALFGAAQTRFLVNGTSGGIHCLLLASVQEKELLIVPRQAHLSVAGGLVLSGATPYYIPYNEDDETHLPLPVDVDEISRALQEAPQAEAVLATYPNYYGLCSDLDTIAGQIRKHDIPLLVDEAHGAHYAFHPLFPPSALSCGAHLTVQSTHKTLSSLTQSSMLHGAPDVDMSMVDKFLMILQSTSPSSLLLASLDSARAHMEAAGERLWARAIAVAGDIRRRLNELPHVHCLGQPELDHLCHAWDPTRLIIGCAGVNGWLLAAQLRQRYGIQVEMADAFYCVVLVGLGDHEIDGGRLVAAVGDLAKILPRSQNSQLAYPPLPPLGCTPREASQSPGQVVDLSRAVGRLSGQILCPYPPGVPVIVPGEVFTAEIVEYMRGALQSGFYIKGYRDDGKVTVLS